MKLNRILPTVLLCCVGGAAMARPAPAPGGEYSHALAMLARREAFWRAHPHGRDPDTGQEEAAARRAQYWQSQARSRAACGGFGGCP